MEEEWEVYASHPASSSNLVTVARLIAETVAPLNSTRPWVVVARETELQALGRETRKQMRERSVRVTDESLDCTNRVNLQTWPNFSQILTHNSMGSDNFVLVTANSKLYSWKMLEDFNRIAAELLPRQRREECSAGKPSLGSPQTAISNAELSAVVSEFVNEIRSRITVVSQPKGLQLTALKSCIDISKPKNDLASTIQNIQGQVEDLSKTLSQKVDSVSKMQETKQQHEEAFACLQKVSEVAIPQKGYFADIEMQLSEMETQLRGLQVHLASLKSTRRQPTRPPLKLFLVSDEGGAAHLAVYNRTKRLIQDVTVCELHRDKSLDVLQTLPIEPHVTLIDRSLLLPDLQGPICLVEGSELLSNIIHLGPAPRGPDPLLQAKGPVQDWFS